MTHPSFPLITQVSKKDMNLDVSSLSLLARLLALGSPLVKHKILYKEPYWEVNSLELDQFYDHHHLSLKVI